MLYMPNLLVLEILYRVQCTFELLLDLLQSLFIAERLLSTSNQDAEFIQSLFLVFGCKLCGSELSF